MTVLVVDRLEPVHVDEQGGRRPIRARRPFEQAGKHVVEPSPIAQAGQAIDRRHAFELRLHTCRFANGGIVVADAAREDSKKIPRDLGRRVHEPPQLLAIDRQHNRRFVGDDVRRGRLPVNQGELADALAGPQSQIRLFGPGDMNAYQTFHHQVHRLVALAGSKEHFLRNQTPDLAARHDRRRDRHGHVVKQA